MALLETHGLTARYGDFQALFGVDITLDQGQWCGQDDATSRHCRGAAVRARDGDV
jgi:hypothetical protein